jgi:argininosuccinate synthase
LTVKSVLCVISSSPSTTPRFVFRRVLPLILYSPNFTQLLYNGLYFSPEREFLEQSIVASQKSVNGKVRCRAYKGNMIILGRSSETEKLYDMSESSMDEIGDFSPAETTGFIGVSAIRLKKYGQMKQAAGEKM